MPGEDDVSKGPKGSHYEPLSLATLYSILALERDNGACLWEDQVDQLSPR